MFNIGDGRSSSANSNNISVGGYAGTHWGQLNLRMGGSYSRNLINTGITARPPARLTDRIDLDVSYIGQYGNRSVDSGATGSFKFRF